MLNMAFEPVKQGNVSVSATDSNTSTQIATTAGRMATQVNFYNSGNNTAYVRFSEGAATATTASFPIPPGSERILSKQASEDYVNIVCATGLTTTIEFCPGIGL